MTGDLDWLAKLSIDFVQGKKAGWVCVDAEHEKCGQIWLAVVHRQSMGFLECPDCGGRGGCTSRVYRKDEEAKLAKRWPGLDPIIHRQDGSIEERRPE